MYIVAYDSCVGYNLSRGAVLVIALQFARKCALFGWFWVLVLLYPRFTSYFCLHKISTRIFEKVVVENLSALRQMAPNHGFCGPEKVLNDA